MKETNDKPPQNNPRCFLPDPVYQKALISLISAICAAFTLVNFMLFSAFTIPDGQILSAIFLFAYIASMFLARSLAYRTVANLISLIYILNAAMGGLFIFPPSYGFHFYLLVVPFFIWIVFPRGAREKEIYALVSIILFMYSEFSGRLVPLVDMPEHAAFFHGYNIIAFTFGSMVCMRYHAYSIQKDTNYLSSLACTDGLTGLQNRRFFDHTGELDFQEMQRESKDLSVLMIDLDHFKAVNDNYGHDAGDKVLSTVSHLLKNSFRSVDTVCRYGGEEFLILLKGTGLKDSLRIAEELRQKIAHCPFDGFPELKVTTSIGVAPMTIEDKTLRDVILRADKALYYAKTDGRNCVKDAENNNFTLVSL